MVVFTLGILDGQRRRWFLGRGATLGNMMRTSDPATARTWPTVAELEFWIDALPVSAKEQIADRELSIVPLRIEVGAPVGTLTLKTVAPATPETPAVREIAKPKSHVKPAPALFA